MKAEDTETIGRIPFKVRVQIANEAGRADPNQTAAQKQSDDRVRPGSAAGEARDNHSQGREQGQSCDQEAGSGEDFGGGIPPVHSPVKKPGFIEMPEGIEIKQGEASGKEDGSSFQSDKRPTGATNVAGGWTEPGVVAAWAD